MWLRADEANEVWTCVEVAGIGGADTHSGEGGEWGEGSQGSRCNYTSQSLWSVARLTSPDYTAPNQDGR